MYHTCKSVLYVLTCITCLGCGGPEQEHTYNYQLGTSTIQGSEFHRLQLLVTNWEQKTGSNVISITPDAAPSSLELIDTMPPGAPAGAVAYARPIRTNTTRTRAGVVISEETEYRMEMRILRSHWYQATDALLLLTLAHEIGHGMGMQHVPDSKAVMFPSISGVPAQGRDWAEYSKQVINHLAN